MKPGRLIQIICSQDAGDAGDAGLRDLALDAECAGKSLEELLEDCAELDAFWRRADNLYERVRALFFLCALHRYHLPGRLPARAAGRIPYEAYRYLLARRFEESIDLLLLAMRRGGPSDPLSSALAAAYHRLAFQTLADQVRRSVRSVRGNQWMFRIGHSADQPLCVVPQLLEADPESGQFPLLAEHTPVRMDLSHSGWSDIFFLGMDYPEGARVLNVSIDLAVRGRDQAPRPPVNAYLRVLDEPVLRLVSVDLKTHADLRTVSEVFDFASDYLGLLKAAVIASGLVPPGMEGSEQTLEDLLGRLAGRGRGLELVSHVNGIPKGSRLAVSTSLLACLISVCMRATGQVGALTGPLEEHERRLVAARAILGEWLAGSGGGWQDSGGLWPGMKLIQGQAAAPGDAEFGISRGRLLPGHHLMNTGEVPDGARRRLEQGLVLVHGGLAQDVGPILEMVTEKYLLRSAAEWRARLETAEILDGILDALRRGDLRALGEHTTRNFEGPIQTIIPWAGNAYTDALIERVRHEFGRRFLGFWMLGGMSGGGMGFIFEPEIRDQAQEALGSIMASTKRSHQHALPFAMDPVVYDFKINDTGTCAELALGREALLPPAYYALLVPRWIRVEARDLTRARRAELETFGAACRRRPEFDDMVEVLFDHLVPRADRDAEESQSLSQLKRAHGFDAAQQEAIRADLISGRLGLAQNRLSANTLIEDVTQGDVIRALPGPDGELGEDDRRAGLELLKEGALAVVTLAAGTGSRWTQGAGVVKALHPFARFGGRYRSFLEVHLAKSRRIATLSGQPPPHVITTSYLTHDPIAEDLARRSAELQGGVRLSPGQAVAVRMIPMVRDLLFAWKELPRQQLDEQSQKLRESLQEALIGWAREAGQASDYTDNLPRQCLHPVGHWYEVANLLKNGVLRELLEEHPRLKHLMLHNVDTLGADPDPSLLGAHERSGAAASFEVISRRVDDLGGGLARVDGRVRLIEGLALPREELEFRLTYHNSMTTWIEIDRLLSVFGLDRDALGDAERVGRAIFALAGRLPTYITLKEVKKRWGQGQEDVFPVSQYEKLWSDMTGLPEFDCRYFVVPRVRGRQLKDPAQLDGWLRDGSKAAIESLCEFPS